MREIRESRTFHHVRKAAPKRKTEEYSTTMVIGGRKLRGGYRTAKQLMEAYEQEEWGGLESRQMFEAGKGVRQPKKAKNNASKEEAGTLPRAITVKRFQGSRLTCVCKSVVY